MQNQLFVSLVAKKLVSLLLLPSHVLKILKIENLKILIIWSQSSLKVIIINKSTYKSHVFRGLQSKIFFSLICWGKVCLIAVRGRLIAIFGFFFRLGLETEFSLGLPIAQLSSPLFVLCTCDNNGTRPEMKKEHTGFRSFLLDFETFCVRF